MSICFLLSFILTAHTCLCMYVSIAESPHKHITYLCENFFVIFKTWGHSYTAGREQTAAQLRDMPHMSCYTEKEKPDREDRGRPVDSGHWRRVGWRKRAIEPSLCAHFQVLSLGSFALFEFSSQNFISFPQSMALVFTPITPPKSHLLSLLEDSCQQGRRSVSRNVGPD